MTFRAEAQATTPVAVLVLHGDLDGPAEPVLTAAHADAVAAAPTALVLDFHDVGYINSTGIALLVGVLAHARQHDMQVRVRGLSPHYRHIFEITRISDFMVFVDDGGPALSGSAASA